MGLEDDFYNAIPYYAQAELDSTDPAEIARIVGDVVNNLCGDLLAQGERVTADLIADFAESEDSE